jgi:hypothetical protein
MHRSCCCLAVSPWCLRAQISEKYGLVYVVTKLGLLFVYDLETATAVYRNRISPDPIFLAANSDSTGGIMAINRCAHATAQQQGRVGTAASFADVCCGSACLARRSVLYSCRRGWRRRLSDMRVLVCLCVGGGGCYT